MIRISLQNKSKNSSDLKYSNNKINIHVVAVIIKSCTDGPQYKLSDTASSPSSFPSLCSTPTLNPDLREFIFPLVNAFNVTVRVKQNSLIRVLNNMQFFCNTEFALATHQTPFHVFKNAPFN